MRRSSRPTLGDREEAASGLAVGVGAGEVGHVQNPLPTEGGGSMPGNTEGVATVVGVVEKGVSAGRVEPDDLRSTTDSERERGQAGQRAPDQGVGGQSHPVVAVGDVDQEDMRGRCLGRVGGQLNEQVIPGGASVVASGQQSLRPLSVPWIAALVRRLDPPSTGSTRRFFQKMGDPPAALTDAFVEAFTQGQRLPNVKGGTAHLIQRFVRLPGRLHPRLWLDASTLAGVTQPTLFLAGNGDFLGDLTAARLMTDAIPGAELAELGRGHLPWLQDAATAAHAVQDFVHRRVTG